MGKLTKGGLACACVKGGGGGSCCGLEEWWGGGGKVKVGALMVKVGALMDCSRKG